MTRKRTEFRMGPAPARPAGPAAKFWNMASIGDDDGEITLYGDILSQQPVDWWTGEPEPGLYITPEGFMEDLAAVKDKSHITVRLNSCGGDLYTGIAIHNALKGLKGDVNVVVEGIAASAASVIMCAGDTVTVYPGSLVMIHGVSVILWDSLNIQDLKRLIKGMDADERAVAEIYSSKTGIPVDTIRGMMTKETWFTGREAVENGFADALGDGEDPEMSLSADKKMLFVNSIGFNMSGIHNIPGTIPVKRAAAPARPAEKNKPEAAGKNKGGNKHMTLEELRTQEPELVNQIEREAQESARTAAEAAERARLQAIDDVAAAIPDQALVQQAKYGEKPCTAQELCYEAVKNSAKAGAAFMAAYKADGEASGAGKVGAVPAGELDGKAKDDADMKAVVDAYNSSKGGKN